MTTPSIAEAISVCATELMDAGRFDAGDVVLAVRLQYPELVEQESGRLVDRAILQATKRWLRGVTVGEEETPLPGMAIPRAIAVPKPSGDFYYAPAAKATWQELLAGLAQRQQNVMRSEAALESYESELKRVQPLMEADPLLTYGEALEHLGQSEAA